MGLIADILSDERRLEKEMENVEKQRNSHSAMPESQSEAAESKIQELEQELTGGLNVSGNSKKGGRAYAMVLADMERIEDAITKLEGQHRRLVG